MFHTLKIEKIFLKIKRKVKKMKKSIFSIIILIIILFSIICIYSEIHNFFQNNLNISYSTASIFSFLCVIILFALIFSYFEKLEKEYQEETRQILSISNSINQLNYDNLNNIKNITILDKSNYQVTLKTNPEHTMSFSITNIPHNQNELELLDKQILKD